MNRKAPTRSTRCDLCATFATTFHNWRLKNNIPLRKIAKDFCLSIATINSWESGRHFPTGHHFEMLADYTGVPPCRLFCVMADKCAPSDYLLALPKKKTKH
jgi:transcriptional regulator with XRE-family HTH domain